MIASFEALDDHVPHHSVNREPIGDIGGTGNPGIGIRCSGPSTRLRRTEGTRRLAIV
jgi:hypothetical protein